MAGLAGSVRLRSVAHGALLAAPCRERGANRLSSRGHGQCVRSVLSLRWRRPGPQHTCRAHTGTGPLLLLLLPLQELQSLQGTSRGSPELAATLEKRASRKRNSQVSVNPAADDEQPERSEAGAPAGGGSPQSKPSLSTAAEQVYVKVEVARVSGGLHFAWAPVARTPMKGVVLPRRGTAATTVV